tara:strand:+ start:1592 stop:2317 length:726 start_codon:yes stop_codon:yes gene_type:complete
MNQLNKPIVTVIMSCFNSENFIEDAVNSITNQSFRDFEFLIMDDGSSDNTYKIIQNLSYEDRRIKIYQNDKNIGLTKSLNLLIKEARGEFIVRQDADDISYVDRLKSQIDILSKSKFSACTTRAKIMDTNYIKPKYTYFLPKKMVIKFKNPFIHGTLAIKKQVLNELGNYDENFYFAQDYKLFSKMIEQGYKIKYLSSVLYEINMKDNISSNFLKQQNYYANCVKNNIKPEANKDFIKKDI